MHADAPGAATVVTSASGGCGTTTVALHLARLLRGCFVEGAARSGAAERLGLPRAGVKTWDRNEDGAAGVAAAALPMAGGFRALFATPSDWCVGEVVSAVAQAYRDVVVDVPAGEALPVTFEAVVVVMPPTVAGALRVRSRVAQLRAQRHALVVNRQGPGGESTRARLESIAGARVAVELPCCPALRDAEDDGALAPRRTRWERRVAALAKSLDGATRPKG